MTGMDCTIDGMSSIVIAIQLPMYGYAGLQLAKGFECIKASWIAIADGGSVTDQGERIIPKPFGPLATILSKTDVAMQEEDSSGRNWSWIIYNESEESIQGQSDGYWPLRYLENVLRIIEQYTEDFTITEWVRNVMEA